MKTKRKLLLLTLSLVFMLTTFGGIESVYANPPQKLTINDSTPANQRTLTNADVTDKYVEISGGTNKENPIEITLDGVTIDMSRTGIVSTNTAGFPAIKITNGSYVKIILKENATSTLKGGYKCAGLQQEGAYLEVAGTGTLKTTGGAYGAGIGGGYEGVGTDITVSSGTVTATGGVDGGAGIGGGIRGAGTNISISGGDVKATSISGAGIGGGSSSTGSNITISGGIVNAKSNVFGAGIGGSRGGNGENITISGGIVRATGADGAQGIGKGWNSSTDASGFSTTLNGNEGTAIIISNTEIGGIADRSKLSGIILENKQGKVYKNQTLADDFEIKTGETLEVPSNTTLTVPQDKTLKVTGTLTNNGTVRMKGEYTGTLDGTVYYEIRFDKNGADSGSAPSNIWMQKDESQTFNDSDCNLTKAHNKFNGWNTKANGSGSGTHQNSATDYSCEKKAVTLYAQWKLEEHDVTFDKNYTGSTADTAKVKYNKKATKPSPDPTRTGYTFKGWFKEKNCTNKWNFNSDKVTGDTHLYAKWQANQYKISFDKNGGTGTAPSPITDDFNSSITLPSGSGLSNGNKNFGGWNTANDGNGSNFAASSSYKIDHASNKTLYAKWTDKPNYTLTYTAGTGGSITSGSATQTVVQGESGTAVTVTANSGYTFSKWSDNKTANPRTDTNVQANITVNAIFTKNATGGGGTGGGGSSHHSSSSNYDNDKDEKSKEELEKERLEKERLAKEKAEKEKLEKEKQRIEKLNKELKAKYPDNLVTGGKVYLDIKQSAWYYESVKFAVENGLMLGTGDNKFNPDMNTTRAMIVTVLYRLSNDEKMDGKNPFTDVKLGTWYYDAVVWGKTKNIISGYDKNTFGADDNITREQLVTILYRYAQYKKYGVTNLGKLDKYSDKIEVAEFAMTPMQWAVANDLVKGTSPTTLEPKKDATRAEIATILMNFIEKFENLD